MTKKSRRGVLLVTGFAAALVACPWIYDAFRERNDPKLMNSAVPGIKLVPRSAFDVMSMIDIQWLGGKRLTVPPKTAVPKAYQSDPIVSGVLRFDPALSTAGPKAENGLISCLMGFDSTRWSDSDGRHHGLASGPLPRLVGSSSYVSLSYVFGDKPKAFELGFPLRMRTNGVSIPKLKIELPPLGIPAPKLKPVSKKVADIELSLEPVAWTGPAFASEWIVKAKGLKPNELLFLRPAGIRGSFRVSPGEAGRLTVGGSGVTLQGIVVKHRIAKIRFSTKGSHVFIVDRDVPIAWGYVGPDGNMMPGNHRPYVSRGDVSFQVDHAWWGESYTPDMAADFDSPTYFPIKFKPGLELEATIYEPVKKATFTCNNIAPDVRAYVLAKSGR